MEDSRGPAHVGHHSSVQVLGCRIVSGLPMSGAVDKAVTPEGTANFNEEDMGNLYSRSVLGRMNLASALPRAVESPLSLRESLGKSGDKVRKCVVFAGSNFEKSGASDQSKSADFSKLGLTGYSGDKVISQRDIQRLVSFSCQKPSKGRKVGGWSIQSYLF